MGAPWDGGPLTNKPIYTLYSGYLSVYPLVKYQHFPCDLCKSKVIILVRKSERRRVVSNAHPLEYVISGWCILGKGFGGRGWGTGSVQGT